MATAKAEKKAKADNAAAQREFNAKQAAKGLKRIEVRAHAADAEKIKKYVKGLNKKRGLA